MVLILIDASHLSGRMVPTLKVKAIYRGNQRCNVNLIDNRLKGLLRHDKFESKQCAIVTRGT